MFYRFGTTPLGIYGKSLLSCDMKLGDFGIELTHGRMVLAYAPKDEGVQLLVLGGAEGQASADSEPLTEQTESLPAMVFREIDWRLSQKSVDTSGDLPPAGGVILTMEEPMMLAEHKNPADTYQAIGLRSGNVYHLSPGQHMRLRAKDWRLDGFVEHELVISLFENETAAS